MSATLITTTQAKIQQEVKQAAATPSKTKKLYDQFAKCSKSDSEFLSTLSKELENIGAIFSDSSRKEHGALQDGSHRFSVLGKIFLAKAEGEDIHVVCIGKLLAEGGYTSIFEAVQLSTKTDAAAQVVFKIVKDIRNDERRLKVAQEEMTNSIRIKKMLPRDSLFSNKHFVVYGDCYTEDRRSIDLFDRIDLFKETATPKLRVHWAQKYFIAVQTLHKNGVVHRDLKLENVLLENETGEVSLTDWGGSITTTSKPDPYSYVRKRIQQKMYDSTKNPTEKDFFDKQKMVDLIIYLNDAYVLMMGEQFIDNQKVEGVVNGKRVTGYAYTSKEELTYKIAKLTSKYSKETAEVFKKYFLCNGIPDFSNLEKDVEAFAVLEQEQKNAQSQSTTVSGA